MFQMFLGCSNLTELDLSSFNTENVTDMSHAFRDCSGLTKLDLSSFNTKKLEQAGMMFYGCTSLINLNISNFVFDNVIGFSLMFLNTSDTLIVRVKSSKEQAWILALTMPNRPSAWTTDNVVIG